MTMPRVTFRLILCLLLLAVASAALAADESKDKGKPKDDEKASPTTKRAAKTHTVTVKNNKYSPAALTIKVGDTVVWTNEDDKDHTVNADDKSFKSDNLSPDDSYEYTFKKAGTFKYACKYHPREKATITVEK
jgi:plastocyanin